MTTYFVSNAGSNTAPYDTEAKAATTLGVIAALPWLATDVVKASSTHTETAGAAITYTFPTTPGLQVLSVLFNGAGTGALTVGAAINVGAASASLTLATGFAYVHGLSLVSGTNANAVCDILIGVGILATGLVLESCTLSTPSATAGAQTVIGLASAVTVDDVAFSLVNCVISSGNASAIPIRYGKVSIDGLTLSGTAPTTVFQGTAACPLQLRVTASDLSAVAWTNLIDVSAATYGSFVASQCKLRSSFVVTTGTFPGPGGIVVELIDCDSGDNHYTYQKHCWEGTIVAVNTIYADASDGTNSISWLMTGNANTTFARPLISPPIVQFNSALSAMTSTVEVTNDGTTFTDAQLWQETLAKVTTGSTMGTWNRADRAAGILTAGANQTTSTKSWTGTSGFGAEVKQKLVSGSFTPAEVGAVSTVVKLAANDGVCVSPKVAIA